MKHKPNKHPALTPEEVARTMKRIVEMTPVPDPAVIASSSVPPDIDRAIWSHASAFWTTPSLEKWLLSHLPQATPSTTMSRQLRAMGGATAAQPMPLDELALEESMPFQVGEIIELDVRSPTASPMYMTILLQRGDQPLLLAYPYDQNDAYQPMQRLELKWQVEDGPSSRRFTVLFSHRPLLTPQEIPSPQTPHNQEAAQDAANSIAIAEIHSGYQIRWTTHPAKDAAAHQ